MMKNLTKRLSALTLALFMVLALLPANTVRADESGEWTLTAEDVSKALKDVEEGQTSLEMDCFKMSSNAKVEDGKIIVDKVKITADYGFTAEVEWAAQDETGKISLVGSESAEKEGQKTTSTFTVSDGGTYDLTLSENAWLYKLTVTEKKPEEEPVAEEPVAEVTPEDPIEPVVQLAAPSSIQATFNSDDGAIKVTWPKVEGAEYYKVSWKTEEQSDRMGYSNFIYNDTADAEGMLSYRIEEELVAGKTYEIFVAAERPDDSRENEMPVKVVVFEKEPAAEQGNEGSEVGNPSPEQDNGEVVTNDPEVVTNDPEVVTNDPEVVTNDPEVVAADTPEDVWNVVPGNLTAVSNCQGIVLTWDAVEDATGYNIYQDGTLTPDYVTEPQYTAADLTADTQYTFTVKAVKDGVEAADGVNVTAAYTGAHDFDATWIKGDESHWNLCKDCGEKGNVGNHEDANSDGSCDVCGYAMAVAWNGIPENLSAKSDCQGIVLTWDAVADATGYNIYLDGTLTPDYVTEPQYTAADLTADTQYTFTVKAVKDGVEAANGETVTAAYTGVHDFDTTWNKGDENHWYSCKDCGEKGNVGNHEDANSDGSCDVCGFAMAVAWNGIPGNLSAKSDCQGIVLTWDAVAGATGYNIYLDGTRISTDYTATECTATNLSAGGTFTFTVKAVKDGVEAADGANVTAAYTGAHDFDATWNKGDESHWNLCKDCGEKGNVGNHEDANSDGSCDVCGYAMAVAWNGIPENLSAKSDCQGIALTWDAVAGATGYNIYLDGTRISTDYTATECTATNLSAGGTFTFTVKAVKDGVEAADGASITAAYTGEHDFDATWNKGDESHWNLCKDCGEKGNIGNHEDANSDGSCDVCGYAMAVAWNGIPGNLSAKSDCQGIALTWDAVADATGYNIYLDGTRISTDYTATECTATNLSAGGTFTFTVKAVKDGVEAADGASVTAAYTGAHDFDATWNKGDESHWNLCKDCGEKGNIGNHEDANSDGSCDVCGYAMAVAWNGIPGNLSAKSDCQGIALTWDAVADATGYNIYLDGTRISTDYTATECTATNLSAGGTFTFTVKAVKDGVEAADGATVTAVYTLTHDFTGGWKSDDSNHWKVCGSCNEKGDMNAHVDENGDGSCDVCGYIIPSNEPSSEPTQPSSEPENGNKPAAPVITSVSCDCEGKIILIWDEVEGAKGYNIYQDGSTRPLNASVGLWTQTKCKITQLTLGRNYSFEVTAVDENGVESDYSKAESIFAQKTHNWNEKVWQKDETSHWYGCKNCSEKENEAAHTMSEWTIDGAYHSRSCTVCGYVESELHKPDGIWSFSEGRHWHVCTVEGCRAEVDGESHVYSDDSDAVCNICGYTRKIVTENVKYNVISSSGSRYMKKSDGDVKVSCDGAFEKFTGITVDGVTVDSRNYTVASGSTVLTLKSSYLDTLKVGSHELVFRYTDGSATTRLLITEHVHSYTPWTDSGNGQTHSRTCACGEEQIKYHRWDNGKVTVRPTETKKGIRTYTCKDCGAKLYKELAPGTNAYTGDTFQMGLWITILVVSAGAIAGIVVVSRIKSKGKGRKGGKFSQSRK